MGLLEGWARETLDNSLRLRFDICTCPDCRQEMLRLMLEQVEVNLPEGASEDDIRETRARLSPDLSRACIKAVEKVGARPPHAILEDRKENFDRLVKKIRKERNLDLRHYHSELLKRRIALRLNFWKIDSYIEYTRLLDKNPQEYDKLFATLCINVSEFFRDPPVWITIRYLLENVIQRKLQSPDRHLRIWSAGCAQGEEPFSLAIILREITRRIAHNLRIEITATDIDKACLKSCEKGEYQKSSLANADRQLLERYFTRQGESYRVDDGTRKLVSFRYLDLTSEETVGNTDLIVCRNVFIYFDRSLQSSILSKFCRSLLPGGYLVLGKTELLPMEAYCEFEEIDGNARIYRKKVRGNT